MEYYTGYELYVEVEKKSQLKDICKKIIKWNKKDENFLYPFIAMDELDYYLSSNKSNTKVDNMVFLFEPNDSANWDDHEKDMLKLSREFPKTLFKLHGEGEEDGDIWDKYFLNGKIQRCHAKIIIDDFDITKLE